MSNAHAKQWKKSQKNKTLKHLKHIVKPYDKPEHILNIIVQSSDNNAWNISLLQEIGVAESNGVVTILAGSWEIAVSTHAQSKCG